MTQASSRRAGAHRKTSKSSLSGKVAVLAAAATSAATAGGAVVANAQHSGQPVPTQTIQLAADPQPVVSLPEIPGPGPLPQILAIPDFKPVTDLAEQLQKAIEYHAQRIAEDLRLRMPEVVRPAQGVLTSDFGFRWGTMHNGVDIANQLGTPIFAAEDGVVIDAGPASGFGQWVRIRHEDGTITVYGHMETINVHVGEHVTAGQQIAGMGSRGFSTGVHLHFEVHPNGSGPIDPLGWLAQRGISL